MAVAFLTNVVVFDQSLYVPSGLVSRWVTKVTTRFGAEAIIAAPMRSGRLKAGISTGVNHPGPKLVEGTISSSAKHTLWVIHGTGFPVKGRGGRIWSRRGFARAKRGLPVTREFFDNKKRDRGTLPNRPLPGTLLAVGKQSLFPPVYRMGSVSGQEPNNFFMVAWQRTARNHSAIRRHSYPMTSALR